MIEPAKDVHELEQQIGNLTSELERIRQQKEEGERELKTLREKADEEHRTFLRKEEEYQTQIGSIKKSLDIETKKNLVNEKKIKELQDQISVNVSEIERYKEIFDKLDSDGDGLISSNKIRLSDLDPDILQQMTPLLQQLQDSGDSYSFREFCIEIDKVLKVKMFTEGSS